MLQRVNFVMMIVVLVLVVIVGVQVFITQRYNTLALQDITTQLAKMRVDAAAEARDRGWSDATTISARPGVIYVDGDVLRTGQYAFPQSGVLTLRRLIAASGGVSNNDDARIIVTEIDGNGESRMKFKIERFKEDKVTDFTLSPGEHVHVERIPSPTGPNEPS